MAPRVVRNGAETKISRSESFFSPLGDSFGYNDLIAVKYVDLLSIYILNLCL